MGLTQGLLSAMVAGTAPDDLRGTAFGFFNLVSGLALLVASGLAGFLWDRWGAPVTFLAGAAFRLEAMKRSNADEEVEAGLNELKQLMLQEQRELRSFITSLRSGPLAAFNDLAKDLQSLATRLSRQWDINCEFSARAADMMIPTRLRLDAHQLMREAVANAVRHASARSVTIELAALPDSLLE